MAELDPEHLAGDLASARIRAAPRLLQFRPALASFRHPQLSWRGGARRTATGRSKRRSMARCSWHQ